MQKLKIGIIGSIWENTPPDGYGGTERVISYLTEGLVKKGHDVTLFACGTSQTTAKLIATYPRPLFRDHYPWTSIHYPLLHITEAFDRVNDFDILHMHLNKSSDYLALPLAVPVQQKIVFTLHFPYPLGHSMHEQRIDRHKVLQKYKDLQYISISGSQRKGGENLHWIGTVYNGIKMSDFTFNPKPKSYFVWLGKFNPDKGVKEAIMAAKKASVPLILAGKVDKLDAIDSKYFEQEIEPLIDNKQITFIGEVGGKKKDQLLGEAKGFLNPIQWNEPFGLTMTESMATGTPVIAFAQGAAPEIISDGKTGFLVNSVDEMVKKIRTIDQIDRQKTYRHVKDCFSEKQMTEGYEEIYRKVFQLARDPLQPSYIRL